MMKNYEPIIKDVLERLGCRFKRSGENIVSTCPSPQHRDSHPSFAIGVDNGLYICYSANCAIRGNLYSFLRDYGRWSQKELQDIPTFAPASGPLLQLPAYAERHDKPQPEVAERRLQHVYGMMCPKYMLERGLTKETLKTFGVGYDEQRRQVTIPVHYSDGQLAGFVRRHIDAHVQPRYLVDVARGRGNLVYNLQRVDSAVREAIIVEGAIDCMWLHQMGYTNVIALLGTTLSHGQCEILKKRLDRYILMLDCDPAGRAATIKHVGTLARFGQVEVCGPFPVGTDAADNTKEGIVDALKHRVPGLKYVVVDQFASQRGAKPWHLDAGISKPLI